MALLSCGVADVYLDGACAEVESLGDLAAGEAVSDYAQAGTRHVRLSGSQDCHVRVHIYASVRFASGALRYTDWLGPEWSQPCT